MPKSTGLKQFDKVIKPEDIIGREDLAKKGDLTYMSDQIEFVRRHVENLSGNGRLHSDKV